MKVLGIYSTYLLDKVTSDNEYLPEQAPPDLGIYEPRIKMIVAMRALNIFDGVDKMLPGLLVPHGFDIEDRYPAYKPSPGDKIYLCDLAERVGLDYKEENISAWEAIPEIKAFKIVAGQMEGDSGMAFLEAAAIRDEKFKQPILAWNNLVSAGFWAGTDMGDTEECIKAQGVIIKAAIYLCKKNKWVEAEEVLKYNLDIMQSV